MKNTDSISYLELSSLNNWTDREAVVQETDLIKIQGISKLNTPLTTPQQQPAIYKKIQP